MEFQLSISGTWMKKEFRWVVGEKIMAENFSSCTIVLSDIG
jgi:hypothetical protein